HRKVDTHLYWDHCFYKLSPTIPENLLVYDSFQLWQRVSQLLKEFKSVLMIKETRLHGFYQWLVELVTIKLAAKYTY
ncbi:MAG: hypothetical protein V3U62_10495, partial [Sedimenticolaceae bacterium]